MDTFPYYEVNFEGPDEEGGSDILVWGWSTHQDAFEWALPLLGKTPDEIAAIAGREHLGVDGLGPNIPMTSFEIRSRLSTPNPIPHPIISTTRTKLRSRQ